MKRLLFVGQFPPPKHGVSIINSFVCEGLSDSYRVDRYDYRFSASLNSISEGGVSVKLLKFFVHICRIFILIISRKYDIVYFTPNVSGGSFFRDVLLVQVFRFSRAKVFLHLHGLGIAESRGRVKKLLLLFMFSRNHVIHVSKKVLGDEFRFGRYRAQSLNYLSNSVDVEFIAGCVREKKSAPDMVIAHMANFRESKGTFDVLRVYEDVKKNIDCKLYMLGDFTNSSFEKVVKDYIDSRFIEDVEFFGFVEGRAKYDLLSQASVFLYPSYDDSFGLVVLEAQALGLPVCAYDIGSMREIVNSKSGKVLAVGDVSNMVDAVSEVIECGSIGADLDFLVPYDNKTYIDRLVCIFDSV